MDKIKTYSIQHHQEIFQLSSIKKDFFFIELGKESTYSNEPRRSETYSITYLKEGQIELQAGVTNQVVNAPAIMAIGPSTVRSIKPSKTETVLQIIYFTDDFLLEKQSNIFYLMEFDFFENNDDHVLSLNVKNAKKFKNIFNLIKNTVNINHIHEAALIKSYIYIIIHEINALHVFEQKHLTFPKNMEKVTPIVGKFKKLMMKEYLKHHSVNFYADRLNVTAKHLSETLKKQTGKTAGQWLNEIITLEAKVLLQNKDLSIAEISEILHFSDQSVFGKFFKTNTELTPIKYRKELNP